MSGTLTGYVCGGLPKFAVNNVEMLMQVQSDLTKN